ncbi:MAG: hypothetical protein B6U73_03660 [Desulfurococcales archaeon ex4484_204]|nr:MAG: hypothetical protein B6U73_03660 [Desulfurococcales archaeon ex4484_204]
MLRYHHLRKKEVNALKNKLLNTSLELYEKFKDSKVGYRIAINDVELLTLNEVPVLIIMKDAVIPTLIAIKLGGLGSLPYAVVDEGAVKHILNGADVMAPGITEVEVFNRGDIVAVWEPSKRSPLTVGRALMSSDEITRIRRGRAIKNLHYAGDKIWQICLRFIQMMR